MTSTNSLMDGRRILLDFDGPVCHLFSGYPAADIAVELRTFLSQYLPTPSRLPMTDDPLEVLRWTGTNMPSLVHAVESMQAKAEYEAVDSAVPTRYADAFLAAAANCGTAVVIVSNNSTGAIERYLDLHGLAPYVESIVGRVSEKPQQMKPNPEPVLRAAGRLNVSIHSCVLIGDSLTDIEAAHASGARSIGYAKRPERVAGLISAGADIVIESMEDVIEALACPGNASK